jgi:hypothetical protein
MINECDPLICSWSQDGEKFIVKDPELLAKNVIPKYFGHNKFSSFSRQLNFYGFKKLQVRTIYTVDYWSRQFLITYLYLMTLGEAHTQ